MQQLTSDELKDLVFALDLAAKPKAALRRLWRLRQKLAAELTRRRVNGQDE